MFGYCLDFRHNHRDKLGIEDEERTDFTMKGIAEWHLTYLARIGKEQSCLSKLSHKRIAYLPLR
jgi:hypothetical protein